MAYFAVELTDDGCGRCKFFRGALFISRYQITELHKKAAAGAVHCFNRAAEFFSAGGGVPAFHTEVTVGEDAEMESVAFSHFSPLISELGEVGVHEVINVAVKDGLNVKSFMVGPVILDSAVIEHIAPDLASPFNFFSFSLSTSRFFASSSSRWRW